MYACKLSAVLVSDFGGAFSRGGGVSIFKESQLVTTKRDADIYRNNLTQL
jgi:hypothetical protein